MADRDGLPVDVLANLMKWPAVERVWLPEWLHHRSETIARLRDAVQRPTVAGATRGRPRAGPALSVEYQLRGHRPKNLVTEVSTGDSRQRDIAQNSSDAHLAPGMGHAESWGRQRSGPASGAMATANVRRIIHAVIETEAPVQQDRLAKLVAGAFGLNRVSEDRRRAIQRAVPREFRRGDDDEFHWPTNVDPQSWRLVRRPTAGQSRPLEEVSLIEIGNALLIVAEESGGSAKDELKREALALFGGRRRRPR